MKTEATNHPVSYYNSELSEQILDYLKKSPSSLLLAQEPSSLRLGLFFLQNSSHFELKTLVLIYTTLSFYWYAWKFGLCFLYWWLIQALKDIKDTWRKSIWVVTEWWEIFE